MTKMGFEKGLLFLRAELFRVQQMQFARKKVMSISLYFLLIM